MKMNSSQLFSLRWNNYLGHMTGAFESLRSGEDFVDVTLSCEGKKIKAHKMLLSACSSYFKEIFKDNPCQHPVIVFRNVRYNDLVALVNFIYQGEVNVVQEQLSSFLATAELLAVKGLTDCNDNADKIKEEEWDFEEEMAPAVHINNTDSPISLTRVNRKSDLKTKKAASTDERLNESIGAGQFRIRFKKNKLSSPQSTLRDYREQSPIEVIPMPQVKVEEADTYDEQNTATSTLNEKSELVKFDNERSELIAQNMIERYNNFSPRTVKENKNEMPSVAPSIADEDNISTNPELLRQLMQQPMHESESAEESIQGHWLSSLNNNNNESNVETENQSHRHTCNICGATYKHLRNLRAHCHLHYGKTKCNLCDKVLCNISYFKKHLQQQHGLLMEYSSRRASSALTIRKKDATIVE